jgi:hypothetical protein
MGFLPGRTRLGRLLLGPTNMRRIKETRAEIRSQAKSNPTDIRLAIRSGIYVGVMTAAGLAIGISGILTYPPGDSLRYVMSCVSFFAGLMLLIVFVRGTRLRWKMVQEERSSKSRTDPER